VAKIGQKSLLGASYVGLSPPPAPEHATGQLRDGDLIPLTRTAKYPETEELLATLSLWLNDGGLAQVHTITSELNKALGGNEQNVRELLQNLDVFTGTLNAQRGQIVSTVESLDRLAVTLSARGDELGGAIDKIEPGLRVLNEQREPLTDALKALDRLSVVGDRTLDHSGDAVRADLHHLRPVLHRLGVAGDDLPDSLDALLTVFMPVTAIPSFLKGDYASASATIDLTAPSMTSGVVPSTAADKVAGSQGGTSPASDLLTGLLTNTVTGGSPPPSLGPPSHGSAPSPENSGMGGLMNELGGG
jgi:phospholipid/cholesterol/gamma-HCH transport system substrate-binding protein